MQRLLTNSLTDKKKEKEGEGEREREIDRLPIRNRRSRLWTGTPSKQHTSCNGSQSEWPGCALRLAAVALLCSQDVSTYDCHCTLYVIPAGETGASEYGRMGMGLVWLGRTTLRFLDATRIFYLDLYAFHVFHFYSYSCYFMSNGNGIGVTWKDDFEIPRCYSNILFGSLCISCISFLFVFLLFHVRMSLCSSFLSNFSSCQLPDLVLFSSAAVAYSFHFQLNLENNLNFEIKGTYSFILEI